MINFLDLHTHTQSSGHAYSSLIENIQSAKAKGLEILGVSDHAPSMPGGPHEFYFSNLRILPEYMEGIRILKGVELNILDKEGNIDLHGRHIEGLDYAIASLHVPCIDNLGIIDNTNAIIGAMSHEKVKIIGHPDDSRFPIDFEKIAKAASEHHVLLEVNNSSLLPTSSREDSKESYAALLPYCKIYNTAIIIGSDAHFIDRIGAYEEALALIDELDFPHELVVNFNKELFWSYLK